MEHRAALAALERRFGRRVWLANLWQEEGVLAESCEGALSRLDRYRSATLSVEVEDEQGRVGFAASPLGEEGFDADELLQRALASASVSAPDEVRRVARTVGPVGPDANVSILDAGFSHADSLDELDAGGMAARLEAASREADSRIFSVRKPTFEASLAHRIVRASAGAEVQWRATAFSLHAETAARQGDCAESAWAEAISCRFAGLDPEAVGREAATRAAELLDARTPPTGRFPVLLDGRVVCDVLDILAPSLLARTPQLQKSLLQNKVGQVVFSPLLAVTDDGVLPGGADTQPVDEEGTVRQITRCVEEGRLKRLLYDRASAHRDGVESTGNGCGGPSSVVLPDVTNLMIPAGKGGDACALAREMGTGLWVREVMGLHTVDPVSGDFSVGCSGLWIEGGEVAHPVTGAALSGNLLEMLCRVQAVGSELSFQGSLSAPALLVEVLDLAG